MATLSFKLNIIPVDQTHVAIVDPQGSLDPLLYNANQIYVVGENLVRYLVTLLEAASRTGFTWSPGEWTVDIAKTANLTVTVERTNVTPSELKPSPADSGPLGTATTPTT